LGDPDRRVSKVEFERNYSVEFRRVGPQFSVIGGLLQKILDVLRRGEAASARRREDQDVDSTLSREDEEVDSI
jgi:hypothetical protein